MDDLFTELKRRNVFKVAIAYLVVSWLTVQVAETLTPRMAMPDWVPGLIIILLIVGFPIALLFAWAYELTPEGIKKSKDIEVDASITHHTSRKIDFIIIGALVLIIGGMAYTGQFSTLSGEAEPVAVSDAEAVPPSIAVLAFDDFSPGKDQEYFADGISDEILNLLVKTNAMRVTGRTSSFSFKGKDDDIPTIASKLNVEHILEGSISKSGNRLKITAQLIGADGTHLWSETYKRDLTDIFDIQEEIAAAILTELKLKLLGVAPAAVTNRTVDVELYNQYLLARELVRKEDRASMKQAIDILTNITRDDPTFAEAQAYLSIAITRSTRWGMGDIPFFEAIKRAEMLVKLALEFGPNTAEAHTAHCRQLNLKNKPLEGEQACRKALAINPNFSRAWAFLAWALEEQYKYEESFKLYQEALTVDPLSPYIIQQLSYKYQQRQNFEAVNKLLARLEAINPNSVQRWWSEINALFYKGLLGEGLHWGLKRLTPLKTPTTQSSGIGFFALAMGEYDLADKLMVQPQLYIKYLFTGEIEKGLEKIQAYKNANPDGHHAIEMMARFEMAAGHYNKAQQYFLEDRERSEQPDTNSCNILLAITHKRLGDDHLAEPIAKECRVKLQAQKKANFIPMIWVELEAGLFIYEGDYRQAIAILEQTSNTLSTQMLDAVTPELKVMKEYKDLRAKLEAYMAEQRAIFHKLQADAEVKR